VLSYIILSTAPTSMCMSRIRSHDMLTSFT